MCGEGNIFLLVPIIDSQIYYYAVYLIPISKTKNYSKCVTLNKGISSKKN